MAKWGEGDPRWIVEERADATNVNNWHWYVHVLLLPAFSPSKVLIKTIAFKKGNGVISPHNMQYVVPRYRRI